MTELSLVHVTLKTKKNAPAHHTSSYKDTSNREEEIDVLRRGQPFTLCLKAKEDLRNYDNTRLQFLSGEPSTPGAGWKVGPQGCHCSPSLSFPICKEGIRIVMLRMLRHSIYSSFKPLAKLWRWLGRGHNKLRMPVSGAWLSVDPEHFPEMNHRPEVC